MIYVLFSISRISYSYSYDFISLRFFYVLETFTNKKDSNQHSYNIFRRTYNAVRYRIARKRLRNRPPDKFSSDDKFAVVQPSATSHQQQQQPQLSNGNPSDGLHSRLSFDPSLPSYYRVSWSSFSALATQWAMRETRRLRMFPNCIECLCLCEYVWPFTHPSDGFQLSDRNLWLSVG